MNVLCFGDSLTTCGGEGGRFSDILQDRFPRHRIMNRGASGESFADAVARLERDVLSARPDVVLVEYGANDWWGDKRPPEAWAQDLDDILGRLRAAGALPVVLGVFGDMLDEQGTRVPKPGGTDARGMRFRELEKSVAARHGCPYVANIQERIVGRRCCWTDRNHPNELGNRYVADTLEPVLEDMLGDRPRSVRKPDLRTTRDLWEEAVALAPDHTAVVDGERRITYADADETVRRVAGSLAQPGAGQGPTVAVFLPNCLEYVLAYWAVAWLGGVVVPLNTWLKRDALASMLRNVRADALIVRSRRDREALAAAAAEPPGRVIFLDADDNDAESWHALTASRKADRCEIAPDALSIIMHTSGTTGQPKGAMMRHSDLLFNVMTAINAHQFSPADVHMLVNPMFHCTALYSQLPVAAYTKTPLVIAPSAAPRPLMQKAARERATTLLSIPSVFGQLVALPDLGSFDVSALRLIAYAGSPMPVRTVRRLQKAFPQADLHNFFGLTETISMTHVLTGEEAVERPDSIGRLLPFVEAEIVDEQGTCRPAGEVGELQFARQNVIPGYVNQPGLLERSLVERHGRVWFRTGDLAAVDQEGYFTIKGRQKDMIIVGGENVYAAEIEGVLMAHERIADGAVKGVPATGPAAFLGERIRAYVVPADPELSEQDVRRFCFERLPSYKVPQRVVFLDKLPRNPSGKVLKAELPPG